MTNKGDSALRSAREVARRLRQGTYTDSDLVLLAGVCRDLNGMLVGAGSYETAEGNVIEWGSMVFHYSPDEDSRCEQ